MKKLASLTFAVALVLGFAGGSVTAATTCTFTPDFTTIILNADCTTDATIFVPDGFTLDGAGHTITAGDPPSGHFTGGVVENLGTVAHVKNLTVTASGLANVCDVGANRLRGILFDGASGSIKDNVVTNINQGVLTSGCQEGNGIEVRNAPFDGTHPNTLTVDIRDNTVTAYQKTGILANGDVFAVIKGNTVTGQGAHPIIAANGIQIGFGGTGVIKDNTVSANHFTGTTFTSTDILIFASDGVDIRSNSIVDGQVGVFVVAGTFGGNNNRVRENTITDPGNLQQFDAIAFIGDKNRALENTITGNNPTTGSGDEGVFVLGDENRVNENVISNVPVGIFIASGSDMNRVIGNVITTTGGAPITNNGTNTRIEGSDYVVLGGTGAASTSALSAGLAAPNPAE